MRQPKRAASSYQCFATDFMKKLREKDSTLPNGDYMKQAGVKWQTLSDKEKLPFEQQHAKDVLRYESQLKELADNGFFMMEGGIRSDASRPNQKIK